MAFSTKRVYIDTNELNAAKIPSGHSVSTAAASLGTPQITETLTFNITASDAVDSTAAAGFDDLLDTELLADIDAYIAASSGFGVDTSSHTVSYNAKVTNIVYGANTTDMYLTSANVSFVVTVELRVYIS